MAKKVSKANRGKSDNFSNSQNSSITKEMIY